MTLGEAAERLLVAWERWDTQCLKRGSRGPDAAYPEEAVTARMEEACARFAAETGVATSVLRERIGREQGEGAERRTILKQLLADRR